MKQLYEAPEVQVINMELQGVIAQSGYDIPGEVPGKDYN